MTVSRPPQAAPGLLLSSSRSIEILEELRVPYEISRSDFELGLARLGRASGGRELLWPTGADGPRGVYRLGRTPLFTHVTPDEKADRLLDATGKPWRRELDVVDAAGRIVSAIRRSEDGSVFLPFDPDDAARTVLREAYLELTTSRFEAQTTTLARAAYYRLRPFVPRGVQLALRRRFARVQDHPAFPRWPVESALHDLYDFVLGLVDEIAGQPVPRLASWPDGKSWAVVLTHDVETAVGYARVEAVLDVERRKGLRSAWFFVPERDYRVADEQVAMLRASGCEIGLHGLHHDGRDLSPPELSVRVPAMRAWAERWGAAGFRAPATHRSWELMPQLGFDYDSSYSDVARYEPQAGGSCSWLPFFIEDLVELPITMPMDHTLFEVLGHSDGSAWHEKAAFLRERGGMALLLTHPDYLDEARLREYECFLEEVAGDLTAWCALPWEVSTWWRDRAASRVVHGGAGWTVEGPAARKARIEFGAPVSV
jgi:peptidoglycan/xylan/chitin deacetylase (PgdA/CDA1 family)